MGLVNILSKINSDYINEAELTDKVARGNELTYDALIQAILNSKEGKVTDKNRRAIANDLGVKSTTSLVGYIKKATDEGFLNSDGTVVKKFAKATSPATEKEEPEDNEQEDESGGVSSGGKISKALDARQIKFIAPKVSNNNVYSEQVFKMLSLMDGQASGSGIKNSLLLSGDPGVGKTSFIRSYAKLLGLPLVTVEAPHITEEHIINIPFMIIRGDKVETDSAVVELSAGTNINDKSQTFEIVQSESNLVTKLKSMQNLKLKDQQHLASVARDKNLRVIYANYRALINTVRDSYNCILFLDEYYRNDNIKIRNILRNILNGRIGNDKIPKGTFIVYASNLSDDGLEEIPMNNDFAEMEFKSPDKEQWFDYMLKKYEQNENKEFPSIKLDHRIYNAFYKTLTKDDLSYDDNNAEVRSSPRRWEQLMLYVNSNLPVANVKEARILMSNVEVNFRNYIEGQVSDLFPKVQKLIIDLVKETSGIDFDGSTHPQTDWKDVLEQQLATKIKMDGEATDTNKEARKYVPVVSGEPGIGKTAHMNTVANNLDLHFIHIDVATLTRESTTGIPKAKQAVDDNGKPIVDQNGNPVMTTEFSKPELLDLIEKKMQEAIEEDSIFPPSERKKGQGRYKFLLLFDELTRADAQVFNSIRKLLLEKSFNEEYDLPSEIMVVGALNPQDEGVGELTKHTRDVVDVIPARASWAKTESYLLSSERPEGLEEALGFDCSAATVGAIKNLLSHFQSKDVDWRGNPVYKEERMFNLREGGDVIYVSPREITDIVTMANSNILNRLTRAGIKSSLNVKVDDSVHEMSDDDFINAMLSQSEGGKSQEAEDAKKGIFNRGTRYSEADFDAFIDAILVELREAWASKMSFTCKKQSIDPANFLSVTTGFIMKNNLVRDQYDAIKTQKVEGVKTMSEMFEAYFDDPQELYDSPHFDNYLAANFGAPQKFVQEITDFVADKISEIQQSDNTGTVKVTNAKGAEIEMPKLASKNFTLYYKYLQYVKVILSVLTGKAEYAGQVREAERTGQYLSNLYTSLQGIGKDFMMNQGLVNFFTSPDKMDGKLVKDLQQLSLSIKDILAKFGFERPTK